MRNVMTYKYEREEGTGRLIKKESDIGKFIEYGVDYQEFDNGPGNYSTAIVEMPDGSVKNIPVENIKFLENF